MPLPSAPPVVAKAMVVRLGESSHQTRGSAEFSKVSAGCSGSRYSVKFLPLALVTSPLSQLSTQAAGSGSGWGSGSGGWYVWITRLCSFPADICALSVPSFSLCAPPSVI